MKPLKHAIAFVIFNPDRSKILVVKRPDDDADLPGVWGLPGGSLYESEENEAAVVRAGREKLGITIEIVDLIGEDQVERNDCWLYMQEYEVRVAHGEPTVPQSVGGVTQYTEWKWSEPKILADAADKGSLCSKIFLTYY